MNDAELSELYTTAIRARSSGDRGSCPPVDALEALVRRRGSEADRVAALDHAMACADCRRELELLRSIDVATPATRTVVPRWASMAAGLVLVAGLATWLTMRDRSDPMRGSSDAVQLVTGRDATLIDGAAPRFVWHPVAGATVYHVEVLSTDGAVVDSGTVTDTTFTMTAPGAASQTAYDWWVRAGLPNGHVVRSPLVRVTRGR